MNFSNYGHKWPASKAYWFKSIRTSIAIALVRFARSFGLKAERMVLRIAPWFREEEGGE